LPYLEAHAFPLIKQRALRHSAFGLAWATIELATSFLPMAAFGKEAVHWLTQAKEFAEGTHHGHYLWERMKELFDSDARKELPELAYQPTLHKEEQKEFSEKAFEFAKTFLDTSIKELPTIPFILVLDDAQG